MMFNHNFLHMTKITLSLLLLVCVSFSSFSQDEVCNSATSNTPIPTLDNDVETSGTLNITEELALTSMEMDIQITHTFIGDVKFTLTSPGGTTINVNPNGVCSDGQNMDATFSDDGSPVMCSGEIPAAVGDISPFSPFSNLNDETSLGTWTLNVTDTGPGDTGTITSWTLNYCGVPSLSIEDNQTLNNVVLAPNPVKENLNIIFPSALQDPVDVKIINILGQTVFSTTTQHDLSIPAAQFSSGIYLINLSTNQFQTSRRFIVD